MGKHSPEVCMLSKVKTIRVRSQIGAGYELAPGVEVV